MTRILPSLVVGVHLLAARRPLPPPSPTGVAPGSSEPPANEPDSDRSGLPVYSLRRLRDAAAKAPRWAWGYRFGRAVTRALPAVTRAQHAFGSRQKRHSAHDRAFGARCSARAAPFRAIAAGRVLARSVVRPSDRAYGRPDLHRTQGRPMRLGFDRWKELRLPREERQERRDERRARRNATSAEKRAAQAEAEARRHGNFSSGGGGGAGGGNLGGG